MTTPYSVVPSVRTAAPMQHHAGPVERVVSWCIVSLLALVALGVWWAQGRPNPALILVMATPVAAQPKTAGWLDATPLGMASLGPAEQYDRETLSDKINGKAELYLTAGFATLVTRRFALATQPERWLEAYLFEMASPRAAFAVYSAQRRPGASALTGLADGYISGNGVFAWRGRHYLEVIGSDLSAAAAAEGVARDMLARLPAEGAALTERDLFPPDSLVADSSALIAENAFGFDKWDQVMVAQLRAGVGELTAFASRRRDPAAARELAEAYANFLIANGGEARPALESLPGAVGVDLFGALEIVFAHDCIVAGIHEAENFGAGWLAAEAFYARIQETVGAP